MKLVFRIAICSISIFLMTCDFYDDRLTIINKSNIDVYVVFSIDSVLSLIEDESFVNQENFIPAGDQNKILIMGSTKEWIKFVNSSADQKLHMFFISREKINNLSSKKIVEMKAYEKRIDIGLTELEESNWNVIYE